MMMIDDIDSYRLLDSDRTHYIYIEIKFICAASEEPTNVSDLRRVCEGCNEVLFTNQHQFQKPR